MRYYIAVELPTKPFIYFQGVANSEAELVALNLSGNPLVLEDANIPPFQFGVSPLKIVNGQLEQRTQAEMDAFEVEYNHQMALFNQVQKKADVQTKTFTYLGISFPMSDAADLYYRALSNQVPASANVQAVERIVPITAAEIPAFIGEYYKKVLIEMTP